MSMDHLGIQRRHARTPDDRPAVVLLSGGQDSVTLLHFAMHRHNLAPVHALSFAYGQRHRAELDACEALTAAHGIPWRTIHTDALAEVGRSALTNMATTPTSDEHPTMRGVPASFVPARNALFLTLAHAYAANMLSPRSVVYGGMCQTDYSGYPDCRHRFVQALCYALNEGYEATVEFKTPLMHLTKAETFALAADIGPQALHDVLTHSRTCYEGLHSVRHDWGTGCGNCPACKLRAKGWTEYKAMETSK